VICTDVGSAAPGVTKLTNVRQLNYGLQLRFVIGIRIRQHKTILAPRQLRSIAAEARVELRPRLGARLGHTVRTGGNFCYPG
jgi:hypothetical protein